MEDYRKAAFSPSSTIYNKIEYPVFYIYSLTDVDPISNYILISVLLLLLFLTSFCFQLILFKQKKKKKKRRCC